MTEEGIIQKVCRGYDSEIAVAIELELIEAIKQEFDNTPFVLHADYAKTIEKKLIGDTK